MFNGNALMGAVSHTFESSMGNSNYKDFEFGKLLMETWGKKKERKKDNKGKCESQRTFLAAYKETLISYNQRTEIAKHQA